MFQGVSIKQRLSRTTANVVDSVTKKPYELIFGLCVFVVAASGGALNHAASASLAIVVLAGLFYIRNWPAAWRELSSLSRLVLIGFALYTFSAFLSYWNVQDVQEYLKDLDRYFRYLAIVPVYLLISREKLNLFPYLLAGAVVSGPVYLIITLQSLSQNPGLPALGAYHHITFGDMAMLSAMFMATVLVLMRLSYLKKAVLAVSIICLLYASVMSQARGAWLALPFCMSLLLFVALRNNKIKLRTVIIALVALAAVIAASPVKDVVTSRINEAKQEIGLYQQDGLHDTSIGIRLELWRFAVDVWKEYPVVGTGPGDFDLELLAQKKAESFGHFSNYSNVHNIYLQALANTGSVGFIILCLALFIFPFILFYRSYKENHNVASLCGMVTLTAFAIFGVTETWTLRAPMVSSYLLFIVSFATAAAAKKNNPVKV